MLKKVLLSGAFVAQCAIPALAQQRQCATPDPHQLPATEQAILEQIERHTQRFVEREAAGNAVSSVTAATVTIPVVVHILYNTTQQNISDAIVRSQIDVLNKDFQRLNTDAANTPAAFQGVAADMQIAFALATRDPNGNPTSGIIHKYTSKKGFEYGGSDPQGVFVKQSSQGGDNAWDTRQYLNIWVCNFTGGSRNLLGYATFPSDAGTYKDGIVIGYKYMGVNPSLGGVYGYGRTATHEVGHWVNLRHIWGDASCGNDFVSDTPTQLTSNGGCPAYPHRTCGNTTSGDMFMNYMDYTYDQCMNLFSAGQKARAQALFASGGARYSLTTSTGLLSPTAPNGNSQPLALRAASVFPNPAVGAASVRVELNGAVPAMSVRVLNMQGAPVYETTLRDLPAGVSEHQLPSLGRGLYNVQITSGGATERIRLAVTDAAE